MPDDILISIVVPVYKVENYLGICIRSILAQTHTTFELILVDDGSPDLSGEICERFSQEDKRIKVIHKKNGGLSDARNAGISISTGAYITFVDSDDYIHRDYLKNMLDVALECNADIVQTSYTSDERLLGSIDKNQDEQLIFMRKDALRNMLGMQSVKVNAWAKLYRRNLFTRIRYPYGRINEDNLTTYKLILESHNPIVCINQNLYFYRINFNGIMHGEFNHNRYSILSFKDEINDYLGAHAVEFKKYIDYAEMRLAIRLYNECIEAGKNKVFLMEQQKIRAWLIQYRCDMNQCGVKYYILLKILGLSSGIYYWLIRLLRK